MTADLLFQTPWWLPTIGVGVGLFVAWTGNQRQEKQVIRGGMAIAIAGLLLGLVSYLVDTPREKAERRTRQIVAAASAHDWGRFHNLLDPQTTVYDLRGPDEITNAAKLAADRYALGTLRISGLNIRDAGTIINVTIRVFAEIQGQIVPPSDWQFQYQNLGQGWVLSDVKANSNQNISEDQIRGRVSH